MAHDQPAVRQPGQEARESRGEIGLAVEIIGAGKGRIGGDAKLPRLAAKTHAQNVEHQFLAVLQPPRRGRAAALPDPGVGRRLRGHLEHGIAHLRKQMHVLVAVDEVGRPAERHDEGLHLRGDLDHQPLGIEPARDRRAHHFIERQEMAVAERRKALAHRLERRRQRDMQAERGAFFSGIELIERRRFARVEMRRRRHHRRRIDAPAQDQFADGGVDRTGNAVIVRAQPDLAAGRAPRSRLLRRARGRRRGFAVLWRNRPRSSRCVRRRNRPAAL